MTTPISGGLRVALRAPLLPDLLLALCVCWIAASVYLSHYGVGNALSSDNVMPYVMFDDLFRRDVGLRGFLWPESPFYFPDTLLAWTIYAVCGSLSGAVTLYAWISSTLFVLLVRTVLRRAGVGTDAQSRAAWLAFLGVWLLVGALGTRSGGGWFGQFYAYVFVPNNHSGALLGALGGFALVLGDKMRAGAAPLALLAVLCAALLVSDRLFEIQFLVPALGYCAFRRMADRSRWHGSALFLLLALLAGAETLRWLFPSGTIQWVAALAGAEQGFQIGGDPMMRVGAGEALSRMAAGFAEIMRTDALTTAIELAALAATAWALFGATRKQPVGAAAATKLVTHYLFGTRALGPVTMVMTAAILLLAGAVAAFIPVRQALAVRPLEALRYE